MADPVAAVIESGAERRGKATGAPGPAEEAQRPELMTGRPAKNALRTTARRKRRSDAGTIKATPRDLELLRFIGEQYAVSLPQLARLMGRSEHAAVWLRKRWQRAGWAEGRALLVGEPVFLWPTRAGLRLAGLDLKPYVPSAGSLAHIAAVNEVRLWVQGRRPEAVWVSERDLARDQERAPGKDRGHRPDGLVLAEGQEVPVEVDLTLKKRERIEQIIRGLLAEYPTVWYFAAPGPRSVLDEVAREVGEDKVQVFALPGEGR